MLNMFLAYASLAIPFLAAPLLAIFAVYLLVVTAHKAEYGILAMLGAFLIETTLVTPPSIKVGLSLSTTDFVYIALLISTIFRVLFISTTKISGAYIAFLLIFSTLLIELTIGLVKIGSRAGVEVREAAYFMLAILYISSFQRSVVSYLSVWGYIRFSAALLILIVVYRWVGIKYGFVSQELVLVVGASSEFRVVGANAALYLSMVSIGYLIYWTKSPQDINRLLSFALLGLLVVLLQHRSVWICFAFGVGVVAWNNKNLLWKHGFLMSSVGVSFLTILIGGLVFGESERLVETLARSLESMFESKGTHVDRYMGWYELLVDYINGGVKVWILGFPFGSGYERWVMGALRDYAPHNFYVSVLLRMGAIGLLSFLVMHVLIHINLLALSRLKKLDDDMKLIVNALLWSSLIYYIPYQASFLHGIIYGLALSYISESTNGAFFAASPLSKK